MAFDLKRWLAASGAALFMNGLWADVPPPRASVTVFFTKDGQPYHSPVDFQVQCYGWEFYPNSQKERKPHFTEIYKYSGSCPDYGFLAKLLDLEGSTLTVPLWLLTIGPLVLGVPHLLADLRYLMVRPGLHQRRGFLLLVGIPLLATLIMPRLWIGLLSVAGAALLARVSWSLRSSAALLALAMAAGTAALGGWALLLFAHAHNGIALVLWWQWRATRPRVQWWIPALFGFGITTLGVAGDAAVFHLGSLKPPGVGLNVDSLAWGLAPWQAGFGGSRAGGMPTGQRTV